MRQLLLGILIVGILSVTGAYLWTRAAQKRLVEATDLARSEAQRLMAEDFSRQPLDLSTTMVAVIPDASVPATQGEAIPTETPEPEAEPVDEPPAEEDLGVILDEEDATTYYRQAEEDLGILPPADREAVRAAIENGGGWPEGFQVEELLTRHAEVLETIETGVGQPYCRPWDAPSRALAIQTPNPESHRFLHSLLLARSSVHEAAGRWENAVFDLLIAMAYAQDLCRSATLPSRLHFTTALGRAGARLQLLIAQRPLTAGLLDRTVQNLIILDQIEPPVVQTLEFERAVYGLALLQASTIQARPGTYELWTGAFDFGSTHHLADAAETGRRFFEQAQTALAQSTIDAIPALTELETQAAASPNPLISAMLPGIRHLPLATALASRDVRLAMAAAALQHYRVASLDFPETLIDLQGRQLRVIPRDPVSGAEFEFIRGTAPQPAMLRVAEVEDLAPAAELSLNRVPVGIPTPTPVPTPPRRVPR